MPAASTAGDIGCADPARIAARWLAGLATASLVATLRDEELPPQPIATLAAFATLALQAGRTLLILVPDDDPLPDLSNALDIVLRPLCLVMPAADFAARIALRATLSLLGSRLARDTETLEDAAWQRQRRHIADHTELWQQARAWAAQNDRSDCPIAVAKLFPVRILPLGAFRNLQQQAADITLLYRCHAPAELVAASGRMLRIGQCAAARGHALAASDETARLTLEREQLTRDIGDLELELATVQAEVAEFMRYYYERVGQRMAQRDALQARLAAAEAARAPQDNGIRATARQWQQQAEQSERETGQFAEAAAEEAPVFRPGSDIKRLFRQIAQQIHPDRADDDDDRAWRTRLMSEANRAYRHGDVGALHEVAALWAEGNAAAQQASSADAGGIRHAALLGQQVARLRARLGEIERELHRLFGSRLYELFIANRQAQRQGRDLLGEMAAQLDASIAELRRNLDIDAA